MTDDAARLAQIRDRSERLAAIPMETAAEHRVMRDMIDSIGDVRWLLEQLEQAPDVAEYRIGSDASHDGNDWPYVEHLPCEQDIWSGRHADGAGLNVAELLTLIATHQCPKAGVQ